MNENTPPPFDPEMTAEQLEITSKLSISDLAELDTILLDKVESNWKKSAFIIASTMTKVPEKFYDIPDVFYSTRLSHLLETGEIEAQGDLRRMRYSEVRLAE